MKYLFLFLSITITFSVFSQSDYVYECNFNPGGPKWTSYNEPHVVVYTKPGKFYIEHIKESTTWYQYQETNINPAEDFEISTAAKQYKGVNDEGFGLIFGADGMENCFVFDIASNGNFAVFKNVDDKYIEIKGWTACPKVKPLNEVNLLVLKNISGKWHFYVNGAEVYSMPAQKFLGSSIGFYVSGYNYVEYDFLHAKQKKKPINLIENYNSFGDKFSLGPNINSKHVEKAPLISADENTLFVTRDEHPGNIGEKKADDIWVSKLNVKDSTWGPLKNIGEPLNNPGNNYVISISNDNNTVLLGNAYDGKGDIKGKGISIAHRTAKGWTMPKEIKLKNYYNYNKYSESCLSADGHVLMITCERDDTYGEKDIYVSFMQADSSWTEPKNIGKTINTFGDETGPFIAADNKTMYFSSAGHPGYGNNDIFMTRRLDDTWKNWTAPKNLGPKINSDRWEAYYTVPASGKNAYLVSTNPTNGSEDIYVIKQPESAKPLPLVLIHGIVYNSATKKPMAAEITYSELGSKKVLGNATSNPETGIFMIALPQGKKYSFNAHHKGFAATHYNFDATNLKKYKEENVDLYLTPLEEGQSIVMNNLFFVANKYEILPESYPELDKLYDLLKEHPTIKIEIAGHTSVNTSGEKFNQDLSSNRALAVKEYVVKKGIAADRISHVGYGYSKPIFKEEKEELQARNRRVEFKIIAK